MSRTQKLLPSGIIPKYTISMSRRRSKSEKKSAKHPFLISWNESIKNPPSTKAVNRQFKSSETEATDTKIEAKKANVMVKEEGFALVKHDIIKSLILTSLILGLETVLYFIWN